ncbi:MAG: hypothetical protein IKB07_01235 [Lachnospiraceae bacterium]|nr:hypothetical protein [Lachnospiraceae bacterium]
MKKGKKWLLAGLMVLLVTGAFATGHYAGAASKTPGGISDPLVTLGYLEKRLATQCNSMEKVKLEKGENLIGAEGTEIILLGGSVTAAGGGLVDVTQGSLTKENTSMFLYHNYIVTEKGAGCEALSACTVFVSGEYTVK